MSWNRIWAWMKLQTISLANTGEGFCPIFVLHSKLQTELIDIIESGKPHLMKLLLELHAIGELKTSWRFSYIAVEFAKSRSKRLSSNTLSYLGYVIVVTQRHIMIYNTDKAFNGYIGSYTSLLALIWGSYNRISVSVDSDFDMTLAHANDFQF